MKTNRDYDPVFRSRSSLVGKRFGKLTVEFLLGSYKNRHHYLCRCDCGATSEVPATSLRSGNTKSCGCSAIDAVVSRNTTHGLSKTPMYGLWRRMIQRCEDQNCNDYRYYGARGVTVCDRWHDFVAFLNDVGQRPPGLTLDRIRNDEGYGPDNFRWATKVEQMNNTRSNIKVSVGGELTSIKRMAEKAGTSYHTMNARLTRLGYSAEDALNKPVKCGQTLEMANANAKLTEAE